METNPPNDDDSANPKTVDFSKKPLEEYTQEEVRQWLTKLEQMGIPIKAQETPLRHHDGSFLAILTLAHMERLHGSFVGRILFDAVSKLKGEFAESHSSQGRTLSLEPTMTHNLRQAFYETEYQDHYGLVARFCAFVNNCINLYVEQPTKYFGPYVALLQSSGYGKSQLIRQLGKQFHVVYVSLAAQKSSAFPPRSLETICAALMLPSNDVIMIEAQQLRLVVAYLQILKQSSEEPAQWYEKNQEHMQEASEQIQKLQSRTTKQLYDDVCDIWQTFPENMTVIFAVDEARSLLVSLNGQDNYFRIWRRTLARLSYHNQSQCRRLFSLVTDTSSQISNFTSPNERDPSYRTRTTKNLINFQPFIQLTTVDLFVSADENNLPAEKALRLGRPLWNSLYKSGLSELIETAGIKLRCGQEWKYLAGEDIENAHIALLGSRFALEVAPKSKIASSLVANNMATLLFVSETRESIYATYISEPVLAEAAAKEMEDVERRVASLNHLIRSIFIGDINAGAVGELTARLLLQSAYDRCIHQLKDQRKNSDSVRAKPILYSDNTLITLHQFFTKMCGDEKIKLSFPKAFVCFTHWIMITVDPDQEMLRRGWNRRLAFILKANNEGTDLFIPFKNSNEKTIRVLAVQVKNEGLDTMCKGHGGVSNRTASISKNMEGDVKLILETVSGLWDKDVHTYHQDTKKRGFKFEDKSGQSRWLGWEMHPEKDLFHLCARDLLHLVDNEQEREALDLLSGRFNVEQHFQGNERTILKSMVPLTFGLATEKELQRLVKKPAHANPNVSTPPKKSKKGK
eukprot:TRINITY_DN962_c0_g1_i2.p1 TRINITY_DN962_c0_g1~~TRINITY_DN962_c0_g1_i2.p1  ORF type:complete len:800 (-),score=95.97 TRINITY_DN962_c0_g1_i2:1265-3664(-)